MRNTLKGLTFAALISLSMLASTSEAFAKDHGRETAWTNLEPRPVQLEDIREPLGVTWEE